MHMRDEWNIFLIGILMCLSALCACGFTIILVSHFFFWIACALAVSLGICFLCIMHIFRIIHQHNDQEKNRWKRGNSIPEDYEYVVRSQRDIANAFEIERRRIERDLHDGAQQYIVAASMDIGEAELVLDEYVNNVQGNSPHEWEKTGREIKERLHSAADRVQGALSALRRTVAGIHPKVLSDLGLEAAVRDIVAASPLSVDLRVPFPLPHIPSGVTAAGYFMVSECLTNAAKYAPDSDVSVLIIAGDDLHITVIDNGPGGAKMRPGGGLMGMRERLAAFGGSLDMSSPRGGPTSISARIPLMLHRGEYGIFFDHKTDEIMNKKNNNS